MKSAYKISPTKSPPITPNSPIATQTVFITNQPERAAIAIEKITDAVIHNGFDISPRISQKIKQASKAVKDTIPAVTHGKNLRPKSATNGPPTIIMIPSTHGYSLMNADKFMALPAGQPALCANTTFASHVEVSTLTIFGFPAAVIVLSQRTSVVKVYVADELQG
jgi:hypothetical protein